MTNATLEAPTDERTLSDPPDERTLAPAPARVPAQSDERTIAPAPTMSDERTLAPAPKAPSPGVPDNIDPAAAAVHEAANAHIAGIEHRTGTTLPTEQRANVIRAFVNGANGAGPIQPQPSLDDVSGTVHQGLISRAATGIWDQGAKIAADTAALPATLAQNVLAKVQPNQAMPAEPPLSFKVANYLLGDGEDADTAYKHLNEQIETEREAGGPLAGALPQVRSDPAKEMRDTIHSAIGPAPLPPAQDWKEKYLVDTPVNLAGTAAEIGLQRKVLPESIDPRSVAGEAAGWEVQNQASGGTPGVGAAMGGTVGAIGHALPKAPVKAAIAEGALFGGSTYLATGNVQESMVNALLPAAMRTPRMLGWARGRLQSAETPADRQAAMDEVRNVDRADERTLTPAPKSEADERTLQPAPTGTPAPGVSDLAAAGLKGAKPIPSLPEPTGIKPQYTAQDLADAMPRAAQASPAASVSDLHAADIEGAKPIEPPSTPSAVESQPSPAPKPYRGKSFQKDIQQELLDRHEATEGGFTDAMQHELEQQGVGAFTFHKQLPEEVKTFMEGKPELKKVFNVTDKPSMAGGEDAMANLGDRYWKLAEAKGGKPIEAAMQSAEKSDDPRAQMLAGVLRNLPPKGERVAFEQRDPSAIATGAEFTVQGHKFQVVEDADGHRVLKDGDDYPILPADQVGKIPIDKGSIKAGSEPQVAAGDFAPPQKQTIPDLPEQRTPKAQHQPGDLASAMGEVRTRFQSEASRSVNQPQPLQSREPTSDGTTDFNVNDLSTSDLHKQAERFGISHATMNRQQLVGELSRVDRENPQAFEDFRPADESAATVEPPKTGKLDQLEQWATKRLAEKDSAEREGLAKAQQLGGDVRRRGSAGPLDPERILLKTVQLAARMAKGGVDRALWVKEQLREFGEDVRQHIGVMWMNARRLRSMDEPARAEWISGRAAPDRLASENPATLAAELGKLKNPGDLANQLNELRTRALSAKAGSEQAKGVAKELARIAQENLPSTLTGKLLNRVAAAGDVRDIARGTQRVSEILAGHNLKSALADVTDLIGKNEIKTFKQPAPGRPGTSRGARVTGDVNPESLKTVKLPDLTLDTRDQIRPLMEQARFLKKQLEGASMPTKAADRGRYVQGQIDATNRFRDIERQIRVAAANDLSQREVTIAGKVQNLEDIKDQAVKTINPPPDTTIPSGEQRGEQSKLKSWWRTQFHPDTLLSNVFGENHPAYQTAIPEMRWAREQKLSTIRDFHTGLEDKLDAAGITAKSRKLDDWLSKREVMTLPSGQKINITRPEMLDLYGHSGDEQTSADIDRGIRWNFDQRRGGEGIKLTRDDIEHIASELSPAERGIVDYFKQFRDKLFPDAAAAKLSLGQSAPDKIKGNYPRARDIAQSSLPSDWRGVVAKRLENITSQKERGQDHKSPILIRNVMDVMADDIHDTADLIHVAEPLYNAAAVLQHPDVRDALSQKYGPKINNQIGQFLFDAAESKTRPQANLFDRAWRRLANLYTQSQLTLNPNTLAKHYLGGSIMASSQFDPHDWQTGMKDATKAGTYDRMVDTSGTMWDRFEGHSLYGTFSPLLDERVVPEARLGFSEAMKAFGAKVAKLQPIAAAGKLQQAIAAIPILRNNDAMIHAQAFAAAEAYVDRVQPGLTGEDRRRAVLDKFIPAVERSQTGNNPTSISYAASKARESGPIQQFLLLFTTAGNKRLNLLGRWGDLSNSQRARLLASIGASALVTAGATYGIKRGASKVGQMITGAPTDQKQADQDVNNFTWNTVSNLADMSYATRIGNDLIRSLATGGKADAGTPIGEMLQGTINGVGGLSRAIFNKMETENGTKKAMQAKDRIMNALRAVQYPTREMLGDPTLPLTTLAGRAYRAAEPPPTKPTKFAGNDSRAQVRQLVDAGKPDQARKMYDKNATGLPSLQRLVKESPVGEALKYWSIMTPQERGPASDVLSDKIIRSKTDEDAQLQMFKKAAIEPPRAMSIAREFRDLSARELQAKRGGSELNDDEEDRLHDLRHYNEERSKILKSDDSPQEQDDQLKEIESDYRADHPQRKK